MPEPTAQRKSLRDLFDYRDVLLLLPAAPPDWDARWQKVWRKRVLTLCCGVVRAKKGTVRTSR
jgi:hypothetical protein